MTNVILCGLGAVGLTYAVKLKDKCVLKILVDETRLKRYREKPLLFNGEEQDFDYILPDDSFNPDLIIITVKSQGLESVIAQINNYVKPDVRIISLINGISSEDKIKKAYPFSKVLKSYFIGHSAVRMGNSVTQDGVGEIVIEHDDFVEEFFKKAGIKYSIPYDINYSMWLKFTLNLFSNQTSAILDMTFGELKQNKHFLEFAKKIVNEVRQIAEKRGVLGLENLEKDSLLALSKMCDEGKTSMHQDIIAKRPTEVDIFAGEIIQLGKKYGIETPYNNVLYDLIKIAEEKNEHSVYSG